jgi:hypothetical protein
MKNLKNYTESHKENILDDMLSRDPQSKGLKSPGEVCGICYSQWCGWGGMENLIVGEFLGVLLFIYDGHADARIVTIWGCFHHLTLLTHLLVQQTDHVDELLG